MNELHQELLKLWKQILPVLEKEKIKYWAIGGTAIGAFREKGFIPWDDDIDICVAEEDLDRFLAAVQKSGLRLESDFNKLNYLPYFKVFGDVQIVDQGIKSNIHIDVFPGFIERKWSKLRWRNFRTRDVMLYFKTRHFKIKEKDSKGKVIFFFEVLFGKMMFFLPTKWLIKKQWESLDKKYIIENSSVNYRYQYFLGVGKFNVSKIEIKQFEDSSMAVNSAFPEDMKHVFGDIMRKPKSNQVWNHNIYIRKK